MVTPATAELSALGATVRLSAQVSDQNGRAMAGVSVTWASGDASVATVDASGLATAVANGTATITATAGSASGSATVTVSQEAAGPLALAPDTAALGDADGAVRMLAPDSLLITELDAAVRILPMGTDANGRALGPGANVTWSSTNPAVATVDASGLVTAVANGRADVTATSGSTSAATNGRRTAASGAASAKLAVLVSDVSVDVDRGTLVALHEATGGDAWTNSDNWLTYAPIAEWHGVEVDGEGRVTALQLGENGLTGTIPPELGDLAMLERLDLSRNGLTAIPPELGSLAKLEWLDLSGNGLTGTIPPELGNLVQLERLDLSGNSLTVIPPGLGSLVQLERLDLSGNGLTVIPPGLGNLAKLEWLDLSGNGLTGAIIPELGGLAKLGRLDLSGNGLTSAIPPELGNLARLEWLDVSDNGLTGPIPPELGNLANLRWLRLSHNGLAGAIPPELGNLANLERLHLFHNPHLSGFLPRSFSKLGALRSLQFQDTDVCAPPLRVFQEWLKALEEYQGPTCAWSDRWALVALYEATGGDAWTNSDNWLTEAPLGEWHGVEVDGEGRVTRLRLRDNNLTGTIPPELEHLAYLEYLYLNNKGLTGLTGTIPPELGNLANLKTLDLDSNRLTGAIPPELGNLASLVRIQLGSNNLTGVIPSELGNLANIQSLSLGANRLTGAIPPELGNLAYLQSLYLANNRLTDAIPPELGNLTNLRWLGLKTNRLTGTIPSELGNLVNLEVLWIYDNPHLSGPLPGSFLKLGALRTLEFQDTDVCAPANQAFQDWIRALEKYRGQTCATSSAADRNALASSHATTGADASATSVGAWTSNANRLTDALFRLRRVAYGVGSDRGGENG